MQDSATLPGARRRRIYVDLDDVLAETIEMLLEVLARDFGRVVPLEEVREFDLERCFGLDAVQLDVLMRRVHRPEQLVGFAPKPGAAATLSGWSARGHSVSIMTGRPPSTAEASRTWLERHGMRHARLACVDKYDRDDWEASDEPLVHRDELPGFGFSLAVEDSAAMALLIAERCEIDVALIDRPWNRDLSGAPAAVARRIVRCRDWAEVAARFPLA